MSDGFPALQPNEYRDTWCGQVLADRVDSEVARGRLGAPPPRPRRADLHRPARPHRARAAGLQPRRGRRRPRARPRAASRGRRDGAAARSCAAPRRRSTASCRPGSSRSGSTRPRCSPTPRRRPSGSSPTAARSGEETRLRYRYLDLRREPMRDAIALRHTVVTAMRTFLNREGFYEIETPVLTRSTPEGARDFLVPSRLAAGLLLRAAAVAAALQAAADGRRLRALLPDRPLLSRRGPARRPPARLHPARPRDVVRHRRGGARPQRAPDRRGARRAWASRSSCPSRASATTRRSPATAATGPTFASASRSST